MTLGLPFSWALVVIAAVVLLIAALCAGREGRGQLWLRVMASGVLLLPLLGLGVWQVMRSADRGGATLIVAVDRSLSMEIEDVRRPGGGTIARALAIEEGWLNLPNLGRLQQGVLLEGRSLGDAERRTIVLPDFSVRRGEQPRAMQTEVVSDLIRLVDGAAAMGSRDVLVLSDGIDTEGQRLDSVAEIARSLGVRVHTVAVGESMQGGDTAVSLNAMAERLIAGEATSLMVQVRGPEDAPPARLVVRERRYSDGTQGAAPTGRVVMERVVRYEAGAVRRIEIPIRPSPRREEAALGGIELFEYTADLEPMPGEERVDNNVARAVVRVTDAPIRVLVLEGEPYWDTRFLIAALRLDADIELSAVQSVANRRLVVRWTEAGAVQLDQRTPIRELIDESDIVVVGRGLERLLDADDAERLRVFVVERGGGLVMLRGRPSSDRTIGDVLDRLAPVDWEREDTAERTRASLTDAGRRSRLFEARDLPEGVFPTESDPDTGAIVSTLPELMMVTRVERERALSVVLLRDEADGSALIAHARTGSGRVLAVLGEGMWRWAIRPPDAFASADAEAVYSSLWRRMTRWLVGREAFLPGEELSVRITPRTVRPDETVRVEVRARTSEVDDERTPLARLIRPDGSTLRIMLRSATDEASARVGFGERGWASSIVVTEPGVYRVTAVWEEEDEGRSRDQRGGGVDLLVVQEDRRELRDVATRRVEMGELAETTGGLVLPVWPRDADVQELLARINDGAEAPDAAPVRRFDPVWDSPWVFLLAVFPLILAWWINRRWGDA